jgi:UDP-glucose 4-epimerase
MKTCLLTGGSGLIGSKLLHELMSDWKLFIVSQRPSVRGEEGRNLHYLHLDLSREWNMDAFPTRIDAIIHLAQSEHFREFPESAENVFYVNTVSTLKLLDYAWKAKAKKFVLASSGGVYGHGDEGFREDMPITAKEDLSFYLGTRLCSEVLAENYSPLMTIVILRFFFVYGPGQRETMLIPRLIKRIRNHQPILLHGGQGIKVNPTYVDDAVQALKQALDLLESQKINVGGPEVVTMRRMGEQIGRAVQEEPLFEVREDLPPHHLIGNIAKMSRLLGEPQVRFEEGIRRTLGKAPQE